MSKTDLFNLLSLAVIYMISVSSSADVKNSVLSRSEPNVFSQLQLVEEVEMINRGELNSYNLTKIAHGEPENTSDTSNTEKGEMEGSRP